MTDMPEKIWATPHYGEQVRLDCGEWLDNKDDYIDSFADMATEYTRSDLAPQWQPIETAPKDGQRIVGRHGVAMFVMEWQRGGVISEEGFWLMWTYDEASHFNEVKPSHWLPLPSPPEDSE